MPRHGSLRASDADRERVVDRLRAAAAEGRLASHELEHRVGAALESRTYGELDATVADLPGARRPRRRLPVSTLRAHPALALAAIPVVLVVVALVAAVAVASLAIGAALFILGRRRVFHLGPGSCAYRHSRHEYWA